MFQIDVSLLRKNNQILNYDRIYEILKSKNLNVLRKECNIEELGRVASYLNLSESEILDKAESDEYFRRLIAMKVSKLATRQGLKLEAIILNGMNETTSKYGISIKSLSSNALRPVRDGGIITGKELKKKGMNKNFDTLKSIDGIIEGKVNGYIFAKVMTGGQGGHQDNVIREAKEFLEWAKKEPKDMIYIVLIDGDGEHKSLVELKNHTTENVWLCDHVQAQKKLIKILKK